MRQSKNCNEAQSAKVAQEQLHNLISKNNLFIIPDGQIEKVIKEIPIQNISLKKLQRSQKYDISMLNDEYEKALLIVDSKKRLKKMKAIKKLVTSLIINFSFDKDTTEDIEKILLN